MLYTVNVTHCNMNGELPDTRTTRPLVLPSLVVSVFKIDNVREVLLMAGLVQLVGWPIT